MLIASKSLVTHLVVALAAATLMIGSGSVKQNPLPNGPLTKTCVHLCCDMQRMFAEDTEWHTPWMPRVVPLVGRIAAHHADQTVFTRFIPAAHAGEGSGTWKRYYERWPSMTLERLRRGMVDLVPDLADLVPPAQVVDKHVYSPWFDPTLQSLLQQRGTDTLVVTGSETDVCVLATVLGAVDRGYRVVVASDAICSSADETHDASLRLYQSRYGQQVEIATTEQILMNWT
jgi:nicotinamidase-related amidase